MIGASNATGKASAVYDKVAGVVRFYNYDRKFGFVNAHEPFLPDGVYLSGALAAAHRASTGGMIVAGARVILGDVVRGPKSYVATSIIYNSVTEDVLKGEWLHATGKWLQTAMGYGFVALECGAECFLHKETVRRCMDLHDVMPFDRNPFLVRVAEGPKGLHVIEIRKP